MGNVYHHSISLLFVLLLSISVESIIFYILHLFHRDDPWIQASWHVKDHQYIKLCDKNSDA